MQAPAMQSNPLDQLKSNHLPDPVSWWPPAPGWWMLAALTLAALALIIWLIVKYIRKTRYRRVANKQAKSLYSRYKQHNDSRRFVHDCNCLLKKTALHAFPDQQPAGLHSHQWLEFLSKTSNNPSFTEESGQMFGAGKYQQEHSVDAEKVYALTLSWIKKHHA